MNSPRSSGPVAPPRNLLIIRLSAIGDIIMASAMIPALRQAWPNARLSWLTEELNADLLRDHPRLDRVIVWPRRRWRQLLRERRYLQWLAEVTTFVRELRRQRFDLVLDAQGLLKSGIWAWLSGSPLRIGLGSKEGSQWLMTQSLNTRTDRPVIGGEYLKLVRALGIEPNGFAMDIVASGAARTEARTLLQTASVAGAYAVICPFTTRPQKHWFADRWAELSVSLTDRFGLRVVMLGGPGDRDAAHEIADATPGLVNLVGQTGLNQCAAVIDGASLLIGVDTGLTHLGIAMKTPTLALFGSTRPYLETGFERAKVLYEKLPCSPCKRKPSCGGTFDCMRAHTVDKVMAEAAALLEPDR